MNFDEIKGKYSAVTSGKIQIGQHVLVRVAQHQVLKLSTL